jgi:hypothetical protein
MNAAVSGSPRAPSCDFCRGSLVSGERHRLVWESPELATDLILADLCSRCATAYASAGASRWSVRTNAVRLVQEVRPSAAAPKVVGFIARGAVYFLVAVTFFLIVTLISSYAR